ncbi:MAG TPA: AAA family ATPase [Sphingobium sp.]
MPDLIIISGCSGGGKSTLIDHLRQSGETVIAEPGRRIIAAEQAQGGSAVPWRDMGDFLNRTLALSRTDLEAAWTVSGRLFLDRGLIDAAVALEHLTGAPAEENIGNLYFYRTVFLAPPWPEIYRTDPDRRHGFADAVSI